ncbi:MAG TPA: hypothetical protein VLA04_06275 [Verrucomicrobiae bacterium]|nr:hypothetical protein [Verrucomicrobiae bacterium]
MLQERPTYPEPAPPQNERPLFEETNTPSFERETEPLSDRVKVARLNRTIVTVKVGNTGLGVLARKNEDGSQKWTSDFIPEGDWGNREDREFRNVLIFSYAFNTFLNWVENFDDWEDWDLQRPDTLLGNATNQKMHDFLVRIFGSNVSPTEDEHGRGTVSIIDLETLLADDEARGRLNALAERCKSKDLQVEK